MEQKYIDILIKYAIKAKNKGNVPVSALIVKNNKVISYAYNKKETSKIPTDHAEIIAIQKACKKLKTWRLDNCILYTTLKPCKMCEGAIIEARIKDVYYLQDTSYYKNYNYNIAYQKISNDNDKYLNILQEFFKSKR